MLVHELRYPGSRPVGLDSEAAHALTCLLGLMESGVVEAAVSLHFFEQATSDVRSYRPQPPSPTDWQRQEVIRSAKRGVRVSGPTSTGTPSRFHAKAFLYAVDAVAQALATTAGEPLAPQSIHDIADDWQRAFPTVGAVRNTSQHEDERILGRAQRKKKIELQPVDNGMILAPGGGVSVLSNLNGNRFGCTMADGHFGEVEVSDATLTAVGDLAQRSINAFTWDGPGRFTPY